MGWARSCTDIILEPRRGSMRPLIGRKMLYPNPQIYHRLKTIFVHVPKTAGTSIERHLQMQDCASGPIGGHTTASAFQRHFPDAFGEYFKFAVVREPVDRF